MSNSLENMTPSIQSLIQKKIEYLENKLKNQYAPPLSMAKLEAFEGDSEELVFYKLLLANQSKTPTHESYAYIKQTFYAMLHRSASKRIVDSGEIKDSQSSCETTVAL